MRQRVYKKNVFACACEWMRAALFFAPLFALGSWTHSGSAFALGGYFNRTPDPYILNLCDYFAQYSGRSTQLILSRALVKFKVEPSQCDRAPSERLFVSREVNSVVQTPFVVELKDLKDVMNEAEDQFYSALRSSNLKCAVNKTIEVELIFRKADGLAELPIPPFEIKSAGRSGYLYDTGGRIPLRLLEKAPVLLSPEESLRPELRCEKKKR